MVIFVLLKINFFLVLFQFSYRLWYLFLYKIWNSFFLKKFKSYLILDLNLFSTDWLNYGNLNFYGRDFTKLSFFKKYILSVYPDIYSKNYNFSNNSVVYLSDFSEKNFPIINEIVENNFHTIYKTSLKDFNKIGNFLLNSEFSNINFKNFMSKNFKNEEKQSLLYNLYNFIFFLENNFFFFLTSKHFFNVSKRNFVKFNFLFLLLLKKIKKNLFVSKYSLENVYDWYNFNTDFLKTFKQNYEFEKKIITNFYLVDKSKDQDNFFKNYTNRIVNFNVGLLNGSKIFLNDLVFNFKNLNDRLFNVNSNLKNSLKIIFSESSTNKFINLNNNFLKRSNFVFFFMRKNKIFNKGRYSRNRQTYRTGFYWCLWVNIFAIYGLHYLCYRFTFAFGYLWLPFIIFFGSFVFSRMLKYNFHNYRFIFSEFNNFYNWLGFLLNNFYLFLLVFFNNFYSFLKNISFFSTILKKGVFFEKINFFKFFFSILKKNLNSLEHTHVWHYLSSKDESFLKLSSKFFFTNQFFFKKKI